MQSKKPSKVRFAVIGFSIFLASCLLLYGLICYITIDATVTLANSATSATLDGSPIDDNGVSFHPIKGTYRLEFDMAGRHRKISIHPLVAPWNPVSDSIYLHVENDGIKTSIPFEEL